MKVRSCFRERCEKISDKIFAPLSVTKNGILPQLDTAVKTDNGDNRKKVLIGDFVVNSRSDRKGSCGISEYDGSVSLINTVLKPLNILADYVHYMFRSNNYIEEYYRQGRGIVADLWTTRYSEMKNIQIPYPPITEQQAIVDYLKDKTLKIEQYVSERERERELLDSLKQSEIANVVTRGLNPNVRMKDSGIFWVPQIPSHWKTTKLKHILVKLYREKSEDAELLVCSNKGKVIKKGDAKMGLVADNNDIYQGVCKGDLLIHGMDTWHGAIAISDYDGMCTPVVHVCDSNQNKKFVAFYLQFMALAKVFKLISNGVRQNTSDFRSWDKVGAIPIMLPPLVEQQAIVDYIEAKLSKIDSCMTDLQAEIDYLKEFKQRLISDVVTGQICVAEPQKEVQR